MQLVPKAGKRTVGVREWTLNWRATSSRPGNKYSSITLERENMQSVSRAGKCVNFANREKQGTSIKGRKS